MRFKSLFHAVLVGLFLSIQPCEAALQIFNADLTATLAVPGFRNRIINGDMRIDQRNSGASQTITSAAALAYTADRFYAYCTGANVTGQKTVTSGQSRYVITGAASVTGIGYGQRIEASNSFDLAGGVATLQSKLSSTSLTTITWTAYYATSTDTFGTIASPTRTQIATGTFTIGTVEAIYSAQITIPAAATTGIEIVFTGGALLASQTLTIGDVQFESGLVATAFERVPIREALMNCYYYYYNSTSTLTYAFNAPTSGAQTAYVIPFPVVMRAAPTMGNSTPSYTNATAISYSHIYSCGCNLVMTVTAGGWANATFSFTASAEL